MVHLRRILCFVWLGTTTAWIPKPSHLRTRRCRLKNIHLWFPTGSAVQVSKRRNTSAAFLLHPDSEPITVMEHFIIVKHVVFSTLYKRSTLCYVQKMVILIIIIILSGQKLNPECMEPALELFHEIIENTPQSKNHKKRSWFSVGDFIRSEVHFIYWWLELCVCP